MSLAISFCFDRGIKANKVLALLPRVHGSTEVSNLNATLKTRGSPGELRGTSANCRSHRRSRLSCSNAPRNTTAPPQRPLSGPDPPAVPAHLVSLACCLAASCSISVSTSPAPICTYRTTCARPSTRAHNSSYGEAQKRQPHEPTPPGATSQRRSIECPHGKLSLWSKHAGKMCNTGTSASGVGEMIATVRQSAYVSAHRSADEARGHGLQLRKAFAVNHGHLRQLDVQVLVHAVQLACGTRDKNVVRDNKRAPRTTPTPP